MKVEADVTITMTACEAIAVRDALGLQSQFQRIEGGLSLGQCEAASRVWSGLSAFLEKGSLVAEPAEDEPDDDSE